jgi:hypothetical protein
MNVGQKHEGITTPVQPQEAFGVLRYLMELNLTKCTFGVPFKKVFGCHGFSEKIPATMEM